MTHYVVHLKLTEILYINYMKINTYQPGGWGTDSSGVRQKQRGWATVAIQAQVIEGGWHRVSHGGDEK